MVVDGGRIATGTAFSAYGGDGLSASRARWTTSFGRSSLITLIACQPRR